MRQEDVIQLYHYQPAGITSGLSWMKYRGHKVTTMWKIKVTKTGLHLCSEDQADFNRRLENEPVEEGTCIHNIEGMDPI